MKKRSIRQRKEAFKQAYYEELRKQGVIDSVEPVEEVIEIVEDQDTEVTEVVEVEEVIEEVEEVTSEETTEEKTKAELIKEAEALGLKVNTKMTKAQIIELINNKEVEE